ncbi:MAG: septal ring lytic transglycosylase RlpA family protein [Jaaginema sp. PMC 1079.18]|nr:septal ring lytic transglycosylase RlpA family protein [Jaaginema sp. PMC 1080.18]MEC4853509.1 septal ring lytic transglycosylase RlpA family protein [Jaaginema sp. PMC 1079.18]MEC4866913.1 septal ring lytic transglycosylase RlpA family protein [Jaaginema sp. PMC 1078.18]
MLIFKFAWVTSWLSVLLASSQSLLKVSDRWIDNWVGHPNSVLSWAAEVPSSATTPPGFLASPVRFPARQLLARRGIETIVVNQTRLPDGNWEKAYWRNTRDENFCHRDPNPDILDNQQATETLVRLPHSRFGKNRLTYGVEQVLQSLTLGKSTALAQATLLTAATKQPLHPYTRLSSPTTVFEPEMVETVNQDSSFQVWVNQKLVAQFYNRRDAELTAERLQTVLATLDFDPQEIRPVTLGGKPTVMMKNRLLFTLNEAIAIGREHNRELLAINWANNLRVALNTSPLSLAEGQSSLHDLVPTEEELEGWASWYGDYFHGRLTANGETYDQLAFTAAHPTLPFDTYLKVTNLENNNSVIVRINDRGPYIHPRTLDLSRGVARCIDSEDTGVIRFKATIMKPYTPLDNI